MTEQVNEKLSAAEIKGLSAMDLLDMEMEVVPEAPGFITPPTGIYSAKLKLKTGTYDKKLYGDDGKPTGETVEEIKISANMKIVEVLEVQQTALLPDEQMPNPEDMCGKSYFGKAGVQEVANTFNAMGKELTGQATPTLRQLLEQFNNDADVDVIVAVKRTSRKKDGETYYNMEIVSIELAPAAQ